MSFPLRSTSVKALVNARASLFVNESATLPVNVFVSAFVKEAASLFLNGKSKPLRDHRRHQAP
jgi:hypothetical protein